MPLDHHGRLRIEYHILNIIIKYHDFLLFSTIPIKIQLLKEITLIISILELLVNDIAILFNINNIYRNIYAIDIVFSQPVY